MAGEYRGMRESYVTIFYVVKIKLFESRMTEQRMTCSARYLFARNEPHPFQDTARLLFLYSVVVYEAAFQNNPALFLC